MAKVILSMDGVVLEEMTLSKERITIGRRPHNDLVINHSTISAEHAVIVTMLGDALLEDLNSTNGTRVNGQPVQKHFLKNDDVIELAKYRIRFVDDGAPRNEDLLNANLRTHSNASRSINKQIKGDVKNDQQGDTELLVGSAADQFAVIKIVTGANAGKEIALTKPLTTIGMPGLQVAVVTKRGGTYSLTHVEGASYPFVNGNSIGPSAFAMTSGDVIDLTGTKMEFFVL